MSRTVRRKNAWDKKVFVEIDDDWMKHMSGEDPFPHISRHRRKYNGCSVEQIVKKVDAKYHSDSFNTQDDRGVKEWSTWFVRNSLNFQLRLAVKNGDEDNLYSSERQIKKQLNDWWLWWD